MSESAASSFGKGHSSHTALLEVRVPLCPKCGRRDREAISHAEELHKQGNLSGAIREYQRAAAIRSGARSAATVEFEEQHAHHMHILGLIRDDQGWALSRILLAERLEEAVSHVIADSPGTPETVKGYLRTALRGF